jgi:small conductance mechanosensitive channel
VTVGNGKIFSDNIVNYSANPYRRVELKAQLAHGVDPVDAIQRLKMAVASVPNICATPAPEVEIFEFNASGTQLVVRPFCANKDYWQVYFDTNRVIQGVAAAANWPAPATVQIQYNHD